MKLFVFDLETGGLDAKECAITQIAAAVVEAVPDYSSFFILNRMSTLIKPKDGLLINEEALKATGLTLERLKDEGRDEARAIEGLRDFVKRYFQDEKKCSPFAHNSSFDMAFMEEACARCNVDLPFNRAHVCTMHMFRSLRFAGYHDSYKANLSSAASALGVAFDQTKAHDAGYDVEITANCLVKMLGMMRGGLQDVN